jgi:hypothetical protein
MPQPQPQPTARSHSLTELPADARLRSVIAEPAIVDGRQALSVRLTDAVTNQGTPGVDYVDQPTFVIIPADFTTGTIEVNVHAGLTATAPDYARGFAGLAYHLTGDGGHFEAVYLRPTNGSTLNPPPPRHLRAVQYFAYPDWPFDRLRETYAEGTYEAGADIAPGTWTHLHLAITDSSVTVTVDGTVILTVSDLLAEPVSGAVGLFVDIGTQAYFADLTITPLH